MSGKPVLPTANTKRPAGHFPQPVSKRARPPDMARPPDKGMLYIHVYADYDSGIHFDHKKDTSDPDPTSWLEEGQKPHRTEAMIPISRQAVALIETYDNMLGDVDDSDEPLPFPLNVLKVGKTSIGSEHTNAAIEAVKAVVQFCEAEARGARPRPRGSPQTQYEKNLCGTDATPYGRLWMLGAIDGFLHIPRLRNVAARGYAALFRNKTRNEVAQTLGWPHPLTSRDYKEAIHADQNFRPLVSQDRIALMREEMEKLKREEEHKLNAVMEKLRMEDGLEP